VLQPAPGEPEAAPWTVRPIADLVTALLELAGLPSSRSTGAPPGASRPWASRRPLAPLLDASVWVQSDASTARARGIVRDLAERPDPIEATRFVVVGHPQA